MTHHERMLRQELQYQGLVAGIAPVYIGMFNSESKSDSQGDFAVIMAKPMTGWLLSTIEWLWNTVARITNKDSYIGSYAIKITGINFYYNPVKDNATDSDE